ncbi:MAG: carbon starvation protein A [Candidatus Delongbacteria bacterium]|nr:carbon starvation protein A [Candidatus Delongbacteria bacterium]
MITMILLVSVIVLGSGYIFYGRFLDRQFNIDPARRPPSQTEYDGIDRVPAHPAVLLGHHFSSIAGAGPIVGPIIAAAAFGWLPALLWILIGSIFIGGVHDYASLVASIRHHAHSIAEITKNYVNPLAYKLMLLFIWLCLVYVITVFTDMTAGTFVQNGGVATSSLLFIILAIGFGYNVVHTKMAVWKSSVIFIPLVFAVIWIGQLIPIQPDAMAWIPGLSPAKIWSLILIIYCFAASITPVWILLQPRDYLSSYLLYASILIGFIGILFGGLTLSYPAFIGWDVAGVGSLFPILFITIACGACSGFHSLIASGTSSKQLSSEKDARLIGYGAMLIEALVAIIALSTLMILPWGSASAGKPPLEIFSRGIGHFMNLLGIPVQVGYAFGLLSLSTFILTSLDSGTRIGRYVVEEFFDLKIKGSRYPATLISLILPTILLLITLHDEKGNPIPVWKAIWPVFGSTNQLLAGIALLVILIWLKKTNRRWWYIAFPLVFMIGMTVWSLFILLQQSQLPIIHTIAIILLILTAILVIESIRTILKPDLPKTTT